MGKGIDIVSILGLVLSIASILLIVPGGVAVNILTPHIQNWMAERSLSNKSKRIVALKKQLESAVYYHNNINKLYLRSAVVVLNTLIILAGSMYTEVLALSLKMSSTTILQGFTEQQIITLIVISITHHPEHLNNLSIKQSVNLSFIAEIIMSLLSTGLFLTASIIAQNHMRLLFRVNQIEKYEKEVADQIKKIEGKTLNATG